MSRRAFRIAAALALGLVAGATPGCAQPRPPADDPIAVDTVRFEGVDFVVVRADMRRARLRMMLRGDSLRSYRDAERLLRARGERMLLATNGGLFDERGPLGLHREDGRTVTPLDLRADPGPGERDGNFFYLPNAVLYQDTTGAVAVRESRRMGGRVEAVRDATQSGPALLLDGATHWLARPPHQGRRHEDRLAACVTDARTLLVVFVRRGTTFPQLTRFLRTRLGCRDAVFLDGNVPGMYLPGRGMDAPPDDFRGVLALTVPARR